MLLKGMHVLLSKKNISLGILWDNRPFFTYILSNSRLVYLYNLYGKSLFVTKRFQIIYYCGKILQNFGLIKHFININDWKKV